MGFSLFLKECRVISKSILYYIISIFVVCFAVFQLNAFKSPKPEPTDMYFGSKITTDKNEIENITMMSLLNEYCENNYRTYPIGFKKEVHLNDENKGKVEKTIEKYTGYSGDEIKKVMKDKTKELKVKTDTDYSTFISDMKQIDTLLGGSSRYSEYSIRNTTKRATYEDTMEHYNRILSEDHVSSAYARSFCDYCGIELGFLPVFLAVARCIRDRKSMVSDIIYSSNASSFSIIFSRYAAVVTMMFIPVLIAALVIDFRCIYYAQSIGVQPYYLSVMKHAFGWLLPTIMFTTAVGFFFTELTGGVIGILIQGVCWFVWLNNMKLVYVGWSFMPRFNGLGNRSLFEEIYKQLVINRVSYAAISVAVILLTVIIFNLKRTGKLNCHIKRLSDMRTK